MLDIFIEAIREKKFIEITFIAKKDSQPRRRTCVPFDYGVGDNSVNDKYHVYDVDRRHPMSLEEDQISRIVKHNHFFNPADYSHINWHTFHVIRDW